ncbi:hypothetical protein V6N12_069216 [Hibiscus sabdariffa]|uniref:Uncharacterized protein n=1 Tax=Hibiscus sabdariffa TaxID=183260 RepID=A0ABR2FDB9_9ROSI
MADGRDGLVVDGVSDLVGRNAGGESALASWNNPFELGGVCRKTKSVNAIVEGLLSPTQRVVISDAR